MANETNPECSIRMHETANEGRIAGWAHADSALRENPVESAYEASKRQAAERPEDEREKFIAAFYAGVSDRLNPKPARPRLLRF